MTVVTPTDQRQLSSARDLLSVGLTNLKGGLMSTINCSTCGVALLGGDETYGLGALCDKCMKAGDSTVDPLKPARRFALGALGLLLASPCISTRASSSIALSIGGRVTETVYHGADYGQITVLAGVLLLVALSAGSLFQPLSLEAPPPRGHIALALGVVVIGALWRGWMAMPSEVTMSL